MLDWLADTTADHIPPPALLAAHLALALALGVIVAVVYVLTRRRTRAESVSFVTTLVLLTVLIAMVTLVIGSNIARAFSLVGALAIVRFRTVVEDTRDTAFVIFAVVVGMAVGADAIDVAVIGIPFVALAALLLSWWGRSEGPEAGRFLLAVRVGIGRDPAELLREVFDKRLAAHRLTATTTARQGAALQLTFLVRLRSDADAVPLVTELNQLDGVQDVELRPA